MRNCPICEAGEAAHLTDGQDFEYGTLPGPFHMWLCGSCGHVYLDPMPRRDQLATIYPPSYYTLNPRSPIHFDGFVKRTKLRRDVDRILALTADRLPRSVLDLGCAEAERLAQLGERLPHVERLTGVDLQPDPAGLAELSARGVEMIQEDVEGGLPGVEDAAYDLVLMCQFIEHLRDPLAVLRSLASKLRVGGRLLIETPNLGGPDYRFFGRHWGGYHFPRHFHIFTRETLELACSRAGLSVVRRGFLPSGFGIVSLRNRLGLSSIERSDRFGEFLHMRNLAVVGAFTAFDLVWIALGKATSNQYVLVERGDTPPPVSAG